MQQQLVQTMAAGVEGVEGFLVEVEVSRNEPTIGTGRTSVVGLTLISSDPYVLEVYPVYQGSTFSEWRVDGVGPGRADLIAIDGYGYEIDYTGVEVRFADYVYLNHTRGSAVGLLQANVPERERA